MRKAFFFCIALLAIIGCQDVKKPEPPENLISEDRMVEILTDAYIGNAAKGINNRMLRTQGIFLDSVLYQKFGIDSLQFASSNAYYTTNLDLYHSLLTRVEERLEAQKTIVDSLYKIEQEALERKKDSTRKSRDSVRAKGRENAPKGALTKPIQDEEE